MLLLLAENGGFLPTRGSFMLDFVFAAMFGIILVMGVSIWLVRYRQKYELHKRIQLAIAAVLLLAVAAFEIDVQFINPNWRDAARLSPFYERGWVNYALWVHLCFAIPTPVLWLVVIVRAVKRFPCPAAPNEHSAAHILWARIAAAGMFMIALTGWVFYWLAFVAS